MKARGSRRQALRHWQALVGIAWVPLLTFAGQWAGFSCARDDTFWLRAISQSIGGAVGLAVGYTILSRTMARLMHCYPDQAR